MSLGHILVVDVSFSRKEKTITADIKNKSHYVHHRHKLASMHVGNSHKDLGTGDIINKNTVPV